MALAVDTSQFVTATNVTSQALPALTTSAPGKLILFVHRNVEPVTSVTSSGLSWSLRTPAVGAEFENKLEEWTATANTALTSHVITVNFGASCPFMVAVVACITGCSLTSPFDTNGSVPFSATSDPGTISTTAPTTLIIAAFRGAWDPPTVGAGWTSIHSNVVGTFTCVEYRIVSSPQTNLSVTQTNGAGFANGVIVDALVPSTTQFGSARIAGSVTVGATPRARLLGSARVLGAVTVTANAVVNPVSSGPWSIDFSSAFGGAIIQQGSALIAGSASALALATHTPRGVALIGGAATVSSTAIVIPGESVPTSPWSTDFSLDFGGGTGGSNPWTGDFSVDFGTGAAATVTWFFQSTIAGLATVSAQAAQRQIAFALIQGSVTVSANALRVAAAGGTIWDGNAVIPGATTVAAAATHRSLGAATIGGSATIAANAQQIVGGSLIKFGAATISGQATLEATARQRFRAAARIAGTGLLSFVGTPINPLPPGSGHVTGARFYVVRITARQPGFGTFVWPRAWATTPWGTAGLKAASVESTSVICASDMGFRSSPSDTDGVVAYPPLINEAFSIDQGLALAPGDSSVGGQWGAVHLANDDGRFDTIAATWNVDGRPVEIRTGTKIWDDTRGIWLDPTFASLTPVFTGVATPWFLDAKELRIPIRDATYWIERPVNADLYSGAGGYNGTAQLTGLPKPMARGGTLAHPIRNVTPTLIDPVAQIYQYNNAPGTVVKVYEGLKSSTDLGGITFQAPDTTDLTSGSTTPGLYRTDNSKGLFQLGSPPIHAITIDCTGEFPNGIGVVTVAPTLAMTLFTADMQLPPEYIDAASFAAAAAQLPYTAGIYFSSNDNPDGVTAVTRVLSSFGAKLTMSRLGLLQCFVLRAVAAAIPFVARLDVSNLISLVPIPLPAAVDPPPYRLRLAWQHNYTVQTSDLNETADQALVQFAATPDTYEGWSSLVVSNQFKRPNDPPPFGGALLVKAEAAQVVADLGLLWGETRALYQAVVPTSVGLALQMGDIVNLVFPMGTLRRGQLGQIVGEQIRSGDPVMTLRILAAVSVTSSSLLPLGVSARYAGVVNLRATAIGRFLGRATIAGSVTVGFNPDVNLASGLRQGNATIAGTVTLAATGRLRARASGQIDGAVTVAASASLLGGVVPPGVPTTVSIDTNLDPPIAPTGVTVT